MAQYKLHDHSECQTSEEEDSRSATATKRRKPTALDIGRGGALTPTAMTIRTTAATKNNNDGATIEVARKPRGRPPGSKNKPKPPVIITRDSDSAMRPHIIEVSSGCDVVETVAQFVRRRQFGLCVITAAGAVANVTLRQSIAPGAAVTFHGRFDILSLTATYLPPPIFSASSSTLASSGGFTISIGGAQGQVVGGSVVGTLQAAGTVVIVAASFFSPSYHRLPLEDEISEQRTQTTPASSSGGAVAGADTFAMSVNTVPHSSMSCQLPSDVLWAPSARPPPPY